MKGNRKSGGSRTYGSGMLLVAMAAVLLVRAARIEGVFRAVRVTSGSMAPAIYGPRVQGRCEDCGHSFAFDRDSPPRTPDHAVCPNCGFVGPQQDARELAGERLLVDRAAWWLSSPQRWDVALAQSPEADEGVVIKRIAGLPGERVAIRGGRIVVNGSPVAKSLATLQQTMILVHDDRHRPKSEASHPAAARWQAETKNSTWETGEAGCLWRVAPPPNGSAADSRETDWLVYHHRPCYAAPGDRQRIAPVEDNDWTNQGDSRELRPVGDLLLHCRARIARGGVLMLRLGEGGRGITAEIRPTDSLLRLNAPGVSPQELRIDARGFARKEGDLVELALSAGRVLVGIGGREVVTTSLPQAPEISLPATPAAVGCAAGQIELSELRLYRDAYYLSAGRDADREQTFDLGADEYLLLGDNAAASRDGRTWARPVRRAELRGRAIVWPFASAAGR